MRDYVELVKELREGAEWAKKLCAHETAKRQSDAADAIEELLAELVATRNQLPKWVSVEKLLPERTNPFHARDVFLVRLRSGCIKTLFYEYDNSDRCRTGMSPLFKEGWVETATPVTHWMPLPEPPKEVE